MMIDTYQTPIYKEIGNLLLHYKRLIPFDKIEPNHFFPGIEALIEEVIPQLEIIESIKVPSWDTVAIPLEEIEEKIHHVLGPIRDLKLVKDSSRLVEESKRIEPFIKSA